MTQKNLGLLPGLECSRSTGIPSFSSGRAGTTRSSSSLKGSGDDGRNSVASDNEMNSSSMGWAFVGAARWGIEAAMCGE